MRIPALAVLVILASANMALGLGTTAQAADSELAQQLSNPVANLISFPIQSNFDFDVGPEDGWRNTTNVQPVIPFTLNEDWNLISRTIVPVIHQNDTVGNSGHQTGISDTLQSLFLSPEAPKPTPVGNLIWGAGPAIQLPTSTDKLLGRGTFGLGPTGVLLFQQGGWLYGALANHVWGLTYTRDNLPDTNNTFLQPFLVYTTPTAWTFSVNGEFTYNWKSDRWSGPINPSISKLVTIGEQKLSLQGRLRYWAAENDDTAEGLGFTLSVTFVFPK